MSINISLIILLNDNNTAMGFIFLRLISMLVELHGNIFPLIQLMDPFGCTYRQTLLNVGNEGQCVEGQHVHTQERLFLLLLFIIHIL